MPHLGDANDDGHVDQTDMDLVVNYWGTSGSGIDPAQDGDPCGLSDYISVVNNMGWVDPSGSG